MKGEVGRGRSSCTAEGRVVIDIKENDAFRREGALRNICEQSKNGIGSVSRSSSRDDQVVGIGPKSCRTWEQKM